MCIVYWKDELLDETLINELLNLDGKEPSLVEEVEEPDGKDSDQDEAV